MREQTLVPENQLAHLLQLEIDANLAYEQALTTTSYSTMGNADLDSLEIIKRDHEKAIDAIKSLLPFQHKRVISTSPWRKHFHSRSDSDDILHDRELLDLLKLCEEQSLTEYQQILQNSRLPSQWHAMIQSIMVPRQQDHIGFIERLLHSA